MTEAIDSAGYFFIAAFFRCSSCHCSDNPFPGYFFRVSYSLSSGRIFPSTVRWYSDTSIPDM